MGSGHALTWNVWAQLVNGGACYLILAGYVRAFQSAVLLVHAQHTRDNLQQNGIPFLWATELCTGFNKFWVDTL